MTAEQALVFLKQTLVTKPGLTVDDCAAIATAWNVIYQAIQTPKAEPPKEG